MSTAAVSRPVATSRLVLVRNASLALFVVALVLALLPRTSEAAAEAGSSGTDIRLPATESQVTVDGHGPFDGMTFTVNQTENLTNQAVSVSWTGGTPTEQGFVEFESDYVQIMQCWGEDDGTDPEHPGPPPEQCVYGAADAVYGGRLNGFGFGNYTLTRVMATEGWPSFDPTAGAYEASTGIVWRPFKAVDGTVVNSFVDPAFDPSVEGGQFWLNPYFNVVTTNEIPGARTLGNGEGTALIEVATGVESPGLGCGQRVAVDGGPLATPKCWLVIVPRGSAEQENAGRPPFDAVATSPLADGVWENRVAIPLEFNPVDSPCAIGGDQRRLGGTELLLPAITNWQPSLCADASNPPFVYGVTGDSVARQQLLAGSAGAPEMIAVSSPIDPSSVPATSPIVYAPLTASGVTIAFNYERNPRLDAPDDELALAGVGVRDINLTPRLVAKLLTQSYRIQTAIGSPSPYQWAKGNPPDLGSDPDFIRFNPEFELLTTGNARNFGGLSMPALNSDAAELVWRWILADPEARAWLDGAPDEWGMAVNPVYATTAAENANGVAFADPVPENFPKSDPYCYVGPDAVGPTGPITPPPLCGTDWLPYTQSFREGAQFTRAASDRAKIERNAFPYTPDTYYKREGPQTPGRRSALSLTDTPSAEQYGLRTARLSRAGDNGAGRTFVAPDTTGLTKGIAATTAGADPSVRETDPAVDAPGAYPLTMLTYGAIRPLALDDGARADYARLVDYAVGDGQDPGFEPGQLRPGYAPLTAELREAARTAAVTIRTLQPVPEAPVAGDGSGTGSFPAGSGSSSNGASSRSAVTTTTAPPAVEEVAIVESASDEPVDAGPLTPILALARNRFFIVALAGIAVISTLGALEVTKRPRRAAPKGGSS